MSGTISNEILGYEYNANLLLMGRKQDMDLPTDASVRREIPEILPGIPAATGLGKL